jgi:hypothetical protein
MGVPNLITTGASHQSLIRAINENFAALEGELEELRRFKRKFDGEHKIPDDPDLAPVEDDEEVVVGEDLDEEEDVETSDEPAEEGDETAGQGNRNRRRRRRQNRGR